MRGLFWQESTNRCVGAFQGELWQKAATILSPIFGSERPCTPKTEGRPRLGWSSLCRLNIPTAPARLGVWQPKRLLVRERI